MMRSGFLTNTEEARNSGSLRSAKTTFDPALLFVDRYQFLIGESLALQFFSLILYTETCCQDRSFLTASLPLTLLPPLAHAQLLDQQVAVPVAFCMLHRSP